METWCYNALFNIQKVLVLAHLSNLRI